MCFLEGHCERDLQQITTKIGQEYFTSPAIVSRLRETIELQASVHLVHEMLRLQFSNSNPNSLVGQANSLKSTFHDLKNRVALLNNERSILENLGMCPWFATKKEEIVSMDRGFINLRTGIQIVQGRMKADKGILYLTHPFQYLNYEKLRHLKRKKKTIELWQIR